MTDVLIAGGGPAGATLALLLGRAGLSVDLFDARRFPREKPCGEGIMPAGVAVLERLGLRDAVGGLPLHSVRYHGFGLQAESGFPGGAGRSVVALAQRRWVLDQVLLDAARATPGVRVFEEAPVEGAEIAQGRAVGLRVGGKVVRGGLIVGADGLDSPLRRSLGLERRATGGPSARGGRIGFRMHFRLAPGRPRGHRLEIFLGRGYELYAAPLPDGELLLAALCAHGATDGSARAALDRWIADQPFLRAWLEGSTPITAPAGRAPVTRRARAGHAPGAVLLGDAAGASDPLTAGGIAHALVTAERLAAFVPRFLAGDEGALARFDGERRRLLRSHGRLTRALLFLVTRPWLARATLRAMRAAPPVMRYLVGVGGGIGLQPPPANRAPSTAPAANRAKPVERDSVPRLPSAPISSAADPATSSATDQNATLSQRAGSS
jgi:2-polyprenyl-6-methoxyphenol hydroxylase-like FAD-dependent oxidoreductase